MFQETIPISVPEIQCASCNASVESAISGALQGFSEISSKQIKINPYEHQIEIILHSEEKLADEKKREIIVATMGEINAVAGLRPYLIGCDLEIIETDLPQSPYRSNQWFLKKFPTDEKWTLWQADSLGRHIEFISISDVPGLSEKLQALSDERTAEETKDVIEGLLIAFQKKKETELRTETISTYKRKGLLSIGFGLLLCFFSILQIALPVYLIATVTVFMAGYVGKSMYYQAGYQALRLQLTIDSLFSISTLSMIVFSLLSVFCPGLHWVPLFHEALLVLGVKSLGTAIMESAITKPFREAKSADSVPLHHKITIKNNGKEELKAVKDLKPGDIIVVSSGQVIPVDARALTPLSVCSTLSNGGDLAPAEKKEGDALLAGMMITGSMVDKPYEMEVTHTVFDSYLMQIDKASEEQSSQSTSEKTQQWIGISVILLIAVGIVLFHFFPFFMAVKVILSSLSALCPCALGLIDPLGNKNSVAELEKENVIVKNNQVLDRIQKNRILGFDLIGTLTTGQHQVLRCDIKENNPEYKKIIYALEQNQTHSVAQAICQSLGKEHEDAELKIEQDPYCQRGRGAKVGEYLYYIGNDAMMNNLQISIDHLPWEKDALATQLIYFARRKIQKGDECKEQEPGEIVGLFQLTDPLRDDAIPTLQALQTMGKQITIFTGSSETTLNRYLEDFRQQGITIQEAQSGCVNLDREKIGPARTKKEIVEAKKDEDPYFMMVGEGENDALALQQAIGIAVQSSSESTAAHSKAQVNIPDIKSLLHLFSVAKIKGETQRQSRSFVIFFNIISALLPTLITLAHLPFYPIISPFIMLSLWGFVIWRSQCIKSEVVKEQAVSQRKLSSSVVIEALHNTQEPGLALQKTSEPGPVVSPINDSHSSVFSYFCSSFCSFFRSAPSFNSAPQSVPNAKQNFRPS